MSNTTWGDIQKKYQEYDEICERHELDVEDIEAEVDGSVDAWVRQSEAVKIIVNLEKALKYCQDDKEVMKNEIAILKEQNMMENRINFTLDEEFLALHQQMRELQEALKFWNPRHSLLKAGG